jgi:Cu/Ag efflux pump CusA
VIGFLMLMGIVTKNAILLVDFAVEEIAKGVERNVAIVDAGRKRARPIVMTTIAMAAGMIPSAMAFGEGGEFRSPMAIAVIGGVLTSTLLTLWVVPVVFVWVERIRREPARLLRWARRTRPAAAPEPAASAAGEEGELDGEVPRPIAKPG